MAGENYYIDNFAMIDGFPLPCEGAFSLPKKFDIKNIKDALNYYPKDDDIILSAYPKSGSTWLQYIVLQIVSKGECFPTFSDLNLKFVPYLERAGTSAVGQTMNPRIYKHHFPYNIVQKNSKSKCIYIYRNPADTVVSFYNFYQGYKDDLVDFDRFFDGFMDGNIAYGNIFKHVLSYYAHREDSNLLMVSYEKLHAHRSEEVLRIAEFLGNQYHKTLQENDEILNKIIQNTSFDFMKRSLNFSLKGDTPIKSNPKAEQTTDKKSGGQFFSKGIVGDGKKVLSDIQRSRIRSAVEEFMKGTTVAEDWFGAS